ncbi:hypothetical protein [Caudoviricetes sp.]|nr:hypothetical protein [Caudoviricetes sp.]
MCLLIKQPAGITFPKRDIRDFVDHNADGFGFMYGDGTHLHLVKMAGNLNQIYQTYQKQVAGREAVLHFRMATHGPKTPENAHPFRVTDSIGMAHNGVLSIGNPVNPHKTDTEHLVDFFIRPVARENPDLLFRQDWCAMLGSLIGSSNRLAFAHQDGRISLVNEESGVTHRTAWLSNTYAWSAPRSAGMGRQERHRYAGWEQGWDGEEDDDIGDPYLPSDSPFEADDEILEWLADFGNRYALSGALALAAMVQQYPARAGAILHVFHKYQSSRDATTFVREHLASAVDLIESLVLEMDCAPRRVR